MCFIPDDSFDFMAEPIHARKKRIAAEKALEKKLKKIVVAGGPKGKGGKSMKSISPSKYTSLLPKAGISIIADPNNPILMPVAKPKVRKNIVRHFANKQIGIRLPNTTASTASATVISQATSYGQLSALSTQVNLAEFMTAPEPTGSDVEVVATPPQSLETGNEEAVKEMTLNLEQNQAFIMELLTRSQPYHDHCYTTVFGRKPGIESMEFDSDGEGDKEETVNLTSGTVDPNKTLSIKFNSGNIANPNHLHIPIIRLQRIGVDSQVEGGDGQGGEQLTLIPAGMDGLQSVEAGTVVTEGPDGQSKFL